MNLYEETLVELSENGKTLKDVIAICGKDFQITIEDFIRCSNTEYDKGYGAPEVATDLLVIGDDFWLERHDYDGLEWWEFKTMPKYKDMPFKSITALTARQAKKIGWETLADLNKEEIKNKEVQG